jgi:hypothetical protein
MTHHVKFHHSEDGEKESIVLYHASLEQAWVYLQIKARELGVKCTTRTRRIEKKFDTYAIAYYIEKA